MASPELAAALRLLDAARRQGFSFHRIAPGEDGPLLGTRETLDFRDVVYLGGFSGDCSATRYRRTSLLVPTGTSTVVETVTGDALTVLHTVCSDWQIEAGSEGLAETLSTDG